MKKINVKILTEIAVFAAIGFVLDTLQGLIAIPFLSQGGSIGIAMLPVFILTFRRGFLPGFLCGLIMGLLDLTDGFYAISDSWYKVIIQLSLDYIISYAVVSVAVIFKNKIYREKPYPYLVLALFVGSFMKFLCHFISGVLFWPNGNGLAAVIYSLTYNSFILWSFILTTIVVIIMYKKNRNLVLLDNK